MKLPKIGNISKDTKQTLYGGIVGALAVNVENGMNWFVAGYPQILKDKLTPILPRNGTLIANIAPAGIAYAVTRKGGSARAQNLRNGLLFYDLPKLVDQLAYNIAYQMGLPTATQTQALRLNIAPVRMNRPVVGGGQVITPVGVGARTGKYTLKTNNRTTTGGGMGRYR